MRDKEIREGLGDLAHAAEKDHEVQMARADLYKLAKYAIKLHDMLKGVSEAEGLEGWVQSKITKSADMIGSVYHHMDYENSPMGEVTEGVDSCAHCGCEVGSPKPGCDCKEDCHSPVTEAANDCDETCPKSCPDCGGTGDPAKFKKSKTNEARDTHCSDKCCGSDVKAEDCTCPPTCKHCNCNAVAEGKYKNDAQRKAVHASKAKKGYKESLQSKLNAKLGK